MTDARMPTAGRLLEAACIIAGTALVIGARIDGWWADRRLERDEARAANRARSWWIAELERWDQAQMDANNRILGEEP